MVDEPEDDEFYGGYGDNALDVPPPELSFTDEQYRRDDLYSQPEFRQYMAGRIAAASWSAQAKRATTDFVAAVITRTVMLSHNKTIQEAMRFFELSVVELKTRFTARDIRTPDYASIMTSLESFFRFMISRTVGGPVIRERMLQHGQHVTQRVEQVVAPPRPVKEPSGSLSDI
jgi:hypothetical protein